MSTAIFRISLYSQSGVLIVAMTRIIVRDIP